MARAPRRGRKLSPGEKAVAKETKAKQLKGRKKVRTSRSAMKGAAKTMKAGSKAAGRTALGRAGLIGAAAAALLPGGPVQSIVKAGIKPAKTKAKKRTIQEVNTEARRKDAAKRKTASSDKKRLVSKKKTAPAKKKSKTLFKAPDALRNTLRTKAEKTSKKKEGPARTVAEAKKRGLSTFTNKAGKKLAAVTAEELAAWEKKTGKKGLRAFLNSKKKG